jgi:hypothetical protein
MLSFEGYYSGNGYILPLGNPSIPEGRKLLITVLDEVIYPQGLAFKTEKETMFGCMKGKMSVPDDFDEPLEEFEEYM